MPPDSDYSQQISTLADVTRSIGAEYGLELLLWATYADWRSVLSPPGEASITQTSAEELFDRLRTVGSNLSWTPGAILQPAERSVRDAEAVRKALLGLELVLREAGSQGPDRRTAHSLVFEGLLSQLERSPARRWEEAATPMRVAELMVALCRRPLGDVLDPAAGLGSSLVASQKAGARSLTGWDIDESVLRVLSARLELIGADEATLRARDSLRAVGLSTVWGTVLLAPPWGTRYRDPEVIEQFPVKVRGTLDLVWLMLAEQLRASGQAVVHLPVGTLTRPLDRAARGVVVPGIEAILALPAGAGAGTGVRSVLMVLSGRATDHVLMLTAEDAASSRRRTLEWNDDVLDDVLGRLARCREGSPAHEIEEEGRARLVGKAALQESLELQPTLYTGKPAGAEIARPDPPGRLITRIWLENFKAFGSAVELELAPITLIYGPNASGKSSIIQSLLLQKQSLESGVLSLSGSYARLGSVGGLAYRHDESRSVTVGFEFAVPVRWDMAREAVSPSVSRAMSLTFSADAAGSPALRAVRLLLGERSFRFVPGVGQDDTGWRLPVDAAVTLTETAADREAIWQADPSKRPLSPRRASDVRRILTEAYGDEGVPVTASALLPDQIDLDLSPYSRGATIDAAELAATSFRRAFGLLSGARANLERALRELCYLGPIRSSPERTYVRGAVSRHRTLDPEGADAVNVLFDSPSEAVAVSEWLHLLKVPYRVTVHALHSPHPGVGDLLHMELLDRRFEPEVAVSAADVGFGVSQLLPLVVQLLVARDQVICIEQPEIHLHPKLQAEFAELLIESVSAEGRANQVIVETHSEHLLLRLQRKIRSGEFDAGDVAVLYVDIDEIEQTAALKRIRLDERGRFLDRWPGGFFDERFAEIFDVATLPTLPTFDDDEDDEDVGGPG